VCGDGTGRLQAHKGPSGAPGAGKEAAGASRGAAGSADGAGGPLLRLHLCLCLRLRLSRRRRGGSCQLAGGECQLAGGECQLAGAPLVAWYRLAVICAAAACATTGDRAGSLAALADSLGEVLSLAASYINSEYSSCTVHHSASQHSTAQHSTVQCIQCSTVSVNVLECTVSRRHFVPLP